MAPTANAKDITITASNIDVARGGNLIVYLFGEDGYPKKHAKALVTTSRSVTSSDMSFTVSLSENQSSFAIKILHDEDENNKVTKNWTGIYPAEGLGFSNEQKLGTFGPPKYKKSKLDNTTVTGPIVISMRYSGKRSANKKKK